MDNETMHAADAVTKLMAELDAHVPTLRMDDVVFRADRDGTAHVTYHGQTIALCGERGRRIVMAGAPCATCTALATKWSSNV